jgi:hypothetical protein
MLSQPVIALTPDRVGGVFIETQRAFRRVTRREPDIDLQQLVAPECVHCDTIADFSPCQQSLQGPLIDAQAVDGDDDIARGQAGPASQPVRQGRS